MKSSIALIGFMGTGKTSVGRALAKKLGKQFVELDFLIAEKAGKSIPAIFRDDGEIAFRELEIEQVKEVAGRKNVVIACGGGVVLNKINIDRLKQEAVIVLLTASPEIIIKRTGHDLGRPLLKEATIAVDVDSLLKFRQPFYERAADITVDTSSLDIAGVVEKMADKLRAFQSSTTGTPDTRGY